MTSPLNETTRIFISYSYVNQAVVPELQQYLSDSRPDCVVWYDTELQGGNEWRAEILKQVDSCHIWSTPNLLESGQCQAT